jgi:hypothetical protein
VNVPSELVVARWNGSAWTSHGNGATTGDSLWGSVTSAGAITSFSPITLASTTTNNPLPIELLSFNAKPQQQNVLVEWVTVSEIANEYFTVERSADGSEFYPVATVEGALYSNELIEYQWLDHHPLSGTSYYRLKQTDIDGSFDFSAIRSVYFSSKAKAEFQAFFAMGAIHCDVRSPMNEAAVCTLFDANGKAVLSVDITLNSGANSFLMPCAYLSEGIYLLQIIGPQTKASAKVFIIGE